MDMERRSDESRRKEGLHAIGLLLALPEVKKSFRLQGALYEIGKLICDEEVENMFRKKGKLTSEQRAQIERNLGLQPLIIDDDE